MRTGHLPVVPCNIQEIKKIDGGVHPAVGGFLLAITIYDAVSDFSKGFKNGYNSVRN